MLLKLLGGQCLAQVTWDKPKQRTAVTCWVLASEKPGGRSVLEASLTNFLNMSNHRHRGTPYILRFPEILSMHAQALSASSFREDCVNLYFLVSRRSTLLHPNLYHLSQLLREPSRTEVVKPQPANETSPCFHKKDNIIRAPERQNPETPVRTSLPGESVQGANPWNGMSTWESSVDSVKKKHRFCC